MSLFYQGISFLKHLAQAQDSFSLHSPYVFSLYRDVERAAKQGLGAAPWLEVTALQIEIEAGWKRIEAERKGLLKSREWIDIKDLGAGSLVNSNQRRRIGAVAASGLLPRSWCRRLAALRMALPTGPVLELGTSFGITTAYLAALPIAGKVITLEGCPATLAQAENIWGRLGLSDPIQIIQGNIDQTLPEALAQGPFSLVILDANHRSGPVLNYFRQILPHIHPNGCIVLDDIYWTPDMTSAWRALQSDASVRQSVDLYRQGWLFLRPGQAREQFVLRALG